MFDVTPYVECLWQVHPVTATQIIQHESGGRPNAINVNVLPGRPRPAYVQPTSRQGAITLAKKFIQLGYSVDMGLMQINSKNLPRYGVTVDEIFDPCTNIRTGSHILYNAYQRTTKTTGDGQTALLKALSIYNTGNMQRGFTNGYVARYTGHTTHLTAAKSTVIDIGDLYD
ncbi:lytic transglycosylase domain-containing protein (plasmid) [Citrobacter sp. OP27]